MRRGLVLQAGFFPQSHDRPGKAPCEQACQDNCTEMFRGGDVVVWAGLPVSGMCQTNRRETH